MIARIWHGWTTPERADDYEHLLLNEIFPGIENKGVAGFKEIRLLRRSLESEIEFMTIMLFDDLESVKEFAGGDYQQSYVPQQAREILQRYDSASQHYELRNSRAY